jgi:hypothetical protein
VNFWKGVKDLALSGSLGLACGAGTGFFVFLRLGFPHDPRTAGYICGLFLLAGFEFGLAVGVSRLLYSKFCRRAK